MANGLKMDKALHPNLGPVGISQLKAGMDGLDKLKCVGCRVHVRYTSGHWKKTSKTWIHAYLGLWSGENHAAGCANTMRSQLDKIVAHSRAVTGNEVFHDDGATITFRLHVVARRMEVALDNATAAASGPGPGGGGTRLQYEKSSRELEDYLNSATAVARLYERLQDGEDIRDFKSRIQVKFRDQTLEWSDFCYEPKRYSKLVKRIGDGKSDFPHPVALVVDAQWIGPYSPKGKPAHSGKRMDGMRFFAKGTRPVRAQAYASDPEVLQRARLGMPHIVVGWPYVGGFNTGDDIGLRILVHFPAQIATVIETQPRAEDAPTV